jgi:hypothetical protein
MAVNNPARRSRTNKGFMVRAFDALRGLYLKNLLMSSPAIAHPARSLTGGDSWMTKEN